MSDEPFNISRPRRPKWTGEAGEFAVVVARGEPIRSDEQMAEEARAQVGDYLAQHGRGDATPADVEIVAAWVVKDHVGLGRRTVLRREHLFLYVDAVKEGRRP